MSFLVIAAIAGAVTLFFLLFLWASFVSASLGEIKVISGPRGQRVLHGKTGWKFPLLERVKFLAIFSSNLDEFFMVRVAGLKRRIQAGVAVTTITGARPGQLHASIL